MSIEFTVPTDSEGFYSLECPHCRERFKAKAGDINEEEVLELFCYSCGLIAECSKFIPRDVIEHARTLAINELQNNFYNSFKKTSRKLNGSGLSMSVNKPKLEVPNLLSEDDDLEPIELQCCGKTIKVNLDQKVTNVYCTFCGVN